MKSVSGHSEPISPFGQLNHTSSNWQERMTLQLLVKVSHSLSLSFGDTGLSKLMENEERPLGNRKANNSTCHTMVYMPVVQGLRG